MRSADKRATAEALRARYSQRRADKTYAARKEKKRANGVMARGARAAAREARAHARRHKTKPIRKKNAAR